MYINTHAGSKSHAGTIFYQYMHTVYISTHMQAVRVISTCKYIPQQEKTQNNSNNSFGSVYAMASPGISLSYQSCPGFLLTPGITQRVS